MVRFGRRLRAGDLDDAGLDREVPDKGCISLKGVSQTTSDKRFGTERLLGEAVKTRVRERAKIV